MLSMHIGKKQTKQANQAILKESNPEYSLERLMLKLQYFGHLMQRADSLEKTLMLERQKAGGEGDGDRLLRIGTMGRGKYGPGESPQP